LGVLLLGGRLVRSAGAEEKAGFARQVGFIGQRIFAPVSGLLFLVGVLMTLDRWSFKDLWIALGVVGFLYAVVTGATIIGPLSEKTGKMIAERGGDDPQVGANTRKLLRLGRVELVVMFLVIAAMTMKPTL
jgi:hypothetical protein